MARASSTATRLRQRTPLLRLDYTNHHIIAFARFFDTASPYYANRYA